MKIRLLRPFVLIGLALAAVPALAETRIEKILKLEPGGQFTLDTELGKVAVRGKSGSGVRLVVTSRRDDIDGLLSFRYEEGARSASIHARRKHRLSSWFEFLGSSVLFQVEVPPDAAPDVHPSA